MSKYICERNDTQFWYGTMDLYKHRKFYMH